MHTKKIQDSLMATSCIRIFILLLSSSFCKSSDQLTHTKPLFPSDELISKGGDFALGFFSPASSNSSLHLGIWYNNIPERTYVWVANRDNPITAAPSTALAITNSSDMVLLDPNGHSVWTTMSNSIARGAGAYAVLLDSGNFVLQLPNGTETWQSFDHPTDTILPTMRFVLSYKDKAVGRLVSWKSPDNPSSGDFSYSSDPSAPTLQAFAWHGIRPYYRNGVANDASVISAGKYLPNRSSMLFETEAELRDEFYFVFTVSPGSPFMHMTLDYKGWFKLLVWNTHSSSWTSFYERPTNTFDLYASCGPYGYSDFTVAPMACRCLDGFEPNGLNFSRGCRRIEELECDKQSQFVTLREMRVPDKFLHIMNRSFDECTAECSNNCSCTAYAYANLSKIGAMGDSSRCLVWSGELIDVAKLRGGEPLYLRLAGSHDKTRSSIKIVLPIIACLMLLTCVALVWICKYRAGKRLKKEIQKKMVLGYFSTSNELKGENTEFPFISFEDILSATNMFADSNLLGQGGFGKVYKGTLEDGNEVAVKRLSKGSGQGTLEYKNEVVLIAKLQHKNLVRLLGCCIHEDEKLLIYEYLPNKSLDAFLFDVARKYELDWSTRFKIIKGIARGLLYLHQDSRLTIVHRDLKASNILLDTEMIPKISDFGMARIFGANQKQANTTRVVGTYGYMSPEYVTRGAFSIKSDTYSFGVVLLEIVSGLKISSPQLIPNFCSLITYAWRSWEDGKATELVDSSFVDSCPLHEVLRCINVGLLCVQDHPDDRPLMSSVMVTLENENTVLPTPKQPVYFALCNCEGGEARGGMENSANPMSITTLDGR